MGSDGQNSEDTKTKEPKETVYTFDVCPNCGCKDAIAGELYDQEKAKGKISSDIPAGLVTFAGPIIDQKKLKLNLIVAMKAPFISAIVDACKNCGALRATKVLVTEATIQQAPPMMPGGMRK